MDRKTHLLIGEAVDLYISDRALYYDTGNGPTRDLQNIKSGLKLFVESLRQVPIRDLDAPTLASIRDQWIRTGKVKRSTINRRMQYVARLVKWCIERGHTTPEQLVGLNAVERLRAGRYGVPSSDPVRPANLESVQSVLPLLPKPMQAWVEMLQLTGMRPGEARIMRLQDLEPITANGKPAFRYTPEHHKTERHGKRRRIFLVGRAYQLTIERISSLAKSTLFEPESEGYLFSPLDDGEKPYSECALSQRVRAKCDKLKVERWAPNQLRHGYATESRSKGVQLDLIADLLGHADPRTTLIYAEPDDDAALNAAIRIAG